MAGKEKKTAVLRHMSKESLAENDKSTTSPKKTRGQKAAEKVKEALEPRKRTPRRQKKDEAAAEASQPSTPRSRKPFLEKELEDILENATGRNTPLDDRAGFFLPKSRREPDDDTLSVRSLTTFLRARRGADDDDVLSVRSVKLRKDDEDTMSVRSLPGKPGRKPASKATTAKAKGKVGQARKATQPNAKPAAKKKPAATKETKPIDKKPLRLQNKIGAIGRSNALVKKKVRNAKIVVKRTNNRKKAVVKETDAPVATEPAVVVKEEPVEMEGAEVPAVEAVTEKAAPLAVSERNGDVAPTTVEAPPAGGKRRRLVRGPPVVKAPVAANGGKAPRKRRWENTIIFDSQSSPDDAGVIIVQPRLGPKVCKMSAEPAGPPPAVAARKSVAASNGAGPSSAPAASTPYFIQTVANFNALKSQPTAQGDWLVTPSGVMLIQAVPQSERTIPVEVSELVTITPPTASPSIDPLVPLPALSPTSPACVNGASSPLPAPSLAAVPSPLSSPVSAPATPPPASVPSTSLDGSAAEPAASLSVSSASSTSFSSVLSSPNAPATMPSVSPSLDVASSSSAIATLPSLIESAALSPPLVVPAAAPSPSLSAAAPSPSLAVAPIPSLSISAVAHSPSSSAASSPSLSGSAVAPSPSLSGTLAQDSMLSEKAREAEPAQAVALPQIPVANNVQDLLALKSHLEDEAVATPCESKPIVFNGTHPARSNGTERRASHDCSFGPLPLRLLRRTGSCDRLASRSPRGLLQTGSEPRPLLVPEAEPTISTGVSLPPAACDRLSPPPASHVDQPAPAQNWETDSLGDPLAQPPSPAACASPPDCLLKPEVLLSSEPAPSALSEASADADAEVKIKIRSESESDSKEVKDEDSNSLMETEASCGDTDGLSVPKDEKPARSAGRTKKYSRSLDSRQSLLTAARRRSHPEPRVINIVTSEDGSRQGLTLAAELRQQLTPASPVPYAADSLPVPYLDPPSSLKPVIEESPEDLASKETILSALGLQSLRAAAELAQRKRDQPPIVHVPAASTSGASSAINNYTGTLKTVIKIQRPEKKGNGRMIYKASSSSGVPLGASPEPAGPSMEAEEPHSSDPSPPSKESQDSGDEEGKNGTGKAKALVIPEKASSFSIHPQRMCSDVCTYCFGKFGLLDTPCHIAQLKDNDKRNNILLSEVHLTLDSCLCDACFRHVDKKSNGPVLAERKPHKRKLLVTKQVRCCVDGCDLDATHNIRRKSLLKLKKSLGSKLTLDPVKLDKLQPTHLVTLCNRHIYWVDYFMSCGICNKRLTSPHMYHVGPEVVELNTVLGMDGIPTVLTEKRFLCKLCQYYASIRLKSRDPNEMSSNQRQFYESCRRRILQSHGIEVPDSEAETEPGGDADKNKIKASKKLKPSATVTNGLAEPNAVARRATKPNADLSDLRAKMKPLPPSAEGFHKCSTTLQFTQDTKELFYELQRPYGNHSSFFRHMVMLEKYFRSGDLVLSRKADHHAVKYINGVKNRLRSYDGVPSVSSRPFTLTAVPPASAATASTSTAPAATATAPAPPPPKAPSPAPTPPPPPPSNHLSQLQSTVHNIGIKPDISITSIGSEPRKLTPKIQENLRALANRASKPGSQTRAVILNRTVGGQRQSLVQVTTGGKTIHLTLSQFRRIQQMQIRKKQYLEQAKSAKAGKSKLNGPSGNEAVDMALSHVPKALSVSVTKVSSAPSASVDLTQSPPRSD